ncbi:MAG: GAF domain-containing sensor histidine kinase [Candidatus Fermentibacteraceae bacterium]|nr:GAF domain-containing sensor histidine kinase [Candidatus Fermentibacteraceae bacterium]
MFIFSVPDDAHALLVSSGSVNRMSRPLTSLLDSLPVDTDALLRALSNQEDGSFPLMLDDRIWISTSTSADEQRLVILKSPSKLELEEWLEISQGGKPSMLVDGSGRIFAVTESATRMFSGFQLATLSGFLDQISMTAFLSAASRCLAGQALKDFSVLTKKGQSTRKSQVISLKKTGVMNELIVLSFSSPSMAMRTLEQDASKFARSLFSVIPLPAVRIDEKTRVLAMNNYAAALLSTDGSGMTTDTRFLDWIIPEDRDRVAMLHRRKSDSLMAPIQFTAGIGIRDDIVRQFEITSLLMPDRESFMLFMVPERSLEDKDTEPVAGQVLGELLKILESAEDTEGHTRMILEFLRIGTGARGAAFVSRSRRVTVGEAVLPSGDMQIKTAREPIWTEDRSGHNVTIPVRQKHDQALVRITGIPSRRTDTLSRLVVALAPILSEYLQSGHHLENMIGLLHSITAFMGLIQGRERDAQVILGEIGAIVGADYSVIHTVSAREPVLKQMVSSGATTEPGALRIEIPSIASWVYTHTEICYVPDTAVDQRFSSIFPSSRSEMAVPLVLGGKTMGTLTIGCTRRDAFGYPIGSFLSTLGTTLSLWLFRESRGARDDENGQQKERIESIPGLEDLLLSISYNIKAPMTALRGYTDLLSSRKLGKLTAEQEESLQSMNMALADLTEYTDQMLNFMKIELRQDSLETAWARPSDVVSSLLPVLAEKGSNHGVSVSAELPPEPFTASFDRGRMEQIISNLASNGIQYNRPRGSVKIEVRMDGLNHWVLEVFNTGEGIPPEDLPNVFDRFFVGGSSAGAGGLGIGLTIVRSFTQQMGGTVNVRSRQGFGSWFTVRLPVS